jgi:tripartite-type tricarboxylate transporter receptor subunit TctC
MRTIVQNLLFACARRLKSRALEKVSTRWARIWWCWAFVVTVMITPAVAGEFPDRPVRIIVQTAAGSSLDVMARLIAEPLSRMWGQPAIIINQAGAGGLIAARALASSPADGYTLFLAGGSVFVVLPELQHDLPFDVGNFVPIGFVAEQPYTLIVSNLLNVKSVAELIEYSKKQPDGLDSVAGTLGGLQHMTVEAFRARSGAKLNMIHYPGAAQASDDVISGRVPMMMQTVAPVAGIIASGQVKLLAVASATRLPTYPNTPLISDTVPGFVSSGWSILVAPQGTPSDIVHKINSDLRSVLTTPEVVKKLESLGNYTRPLGPLELAEFVSKERATWGPIARLVGKSEQ